MGPAENDLAEKVHTFGPDAIPPLILLLEHENPGVRKMAGYTIREIDGLGSEHLDAADAREKDLTTLRTALTYRLRSNRLMTFENQDFNNDSKDPLFTNDWSQILPGAMKIF